MNLRILTLGFMIVLLAACGGNDEPAALGPDRDVPAVGAAADTAAAAAVAAETARINAWFDARFEENLDFSPMQKTSLGRKQDYDLID